MSRSRGSLPLDEQVVLDRVLDEAFAPARRRTAAISPARVRARVAWHRPQPAGAGWRGIALLGRLGETSLALGATALIFVSTLGGIGAQHETVQPEAGSEFVVRVSAQLDEARFFRFVRIGRVAPEMDDVDPATALRPPADDTDPSAAVRERQGVLR